MKTIRFTVEVEWSAPDDFDASQIVAFRLPKKGEKFLAACGEVRVADCDWANPPRPIIDDWQWPEWLTAAAVVMFRDGSWAATESIPSPCGDSWLGCGYILPLRLLDFVPPVCDDWRKSLRINPKFRVDKKE